MSTSPWRSDPDLALSTSRWRSDPDLAKRFHPQYRDDLQVMVHDGEPLRTQRVPEICWVRVDSVHATLRFPVMPRGVSLPLDPADAQWVARVVYDGTLLNQPKKLTEIRQGSDVLFMYAPGLPHPLQVRPMYLEERARWAFAPCDGCGTDQALDPPSMMVRTRFSDVPSRAVPVAFSAVCPCGGTMVLSKLMGAEIAKG